MIPRTFPSIIEAFQTKMVVYVLPSITGLRAWIDYIPVKGVVTESATLANTYANGGYQVVKSLDSLTGLQAWIGYIPVYEDAAYNKPWSTDAGGYIPVGGLFSIPSLFASGAKGVWYDPSDYSTLFQDSTGTTPVTAVEQPVGLMLDKSQGLVLGPELVTNGDFSNGDTGWILSAGVTVSGGTANWTAGASNLSARQTGILTVGKTYQVTYTISSISSGGFKVSIGAEGPTYTSAGTYTARLTASSTQISILSQGASTTGSIDNISVKELPGNHAFQSTSASRPVLRIDGNGKYFLRFDGVDDSLSTNSISFTSTDKMSLFAGVRKLSDAAIAVLYELSSNFGSNDGTFCMFAPNPAAGNYAFRSRGTLTAAVNITSGVSAPVTNSVTGLADIAATSMTIRNNGVVIEASTSANQGTGNYGNYPLFIGRRGGSSLPFNGQLYSMVIVGKAVTAGELTSTEAYVNQKTGAY